MTDQLPNDPSPSDELDLGQALGASDSASVQVLTLYIPNKDQDGREFGTQPQWVLEAATLLAKIGGGVTILPPVEGGWLNKKTQNLIWESPILVYTYVDPDKLEELLPELCSFLHRLGHETNQGEVAFEFDRTFFRITQFDDDTEARS